MPTLVHLSDLHFGSPHNHHLSDLVLKEIDTLHPEVVVISGDWTMRARHSEYQAARDYLARFTRPVLTIPGNHDQPLFAPMERLTTPFARYEKYIGAIDSTLSAGGFFIAGLNDNAPIVPGGFWSKRQRAWLAQQMANAPRDALKVVTTHHQLMWEGKSRPAGFWFPSRALEFLAECGVELVLNGHTHISGVAASPQGIVVARSGTTTSTRARHGNANAYNVIDVNEKQIAVSVRRYDQQRDAFMVERAVTFARRNNSAIRNSKF